MTAPFDVLRYERALERWRALAERRLEHMTQLYETGRWRRYFSEEKFLSVIRETKAAAEHWQRLAPEHAPAMQPLPIAFEPPPVRTQPPLSPFAAEPEEWHRSVAGASLVQAAGEAQHLQQDRFAGIDELFERDARSRALAL